MTSTTTQNHSDASVLEPEEGRFLEGLRVRVLASGATTGGMTCVMTCVNPGPGGPPLHIHRGHDEWYFVMAGRYRFKIEDTVHEGGPGTFAYVPRGVVHTFASVGTKEGRLISASMPAGLEHFLERMEELNRRGAAPEEYEALHREYDSEIVGPPLF